LHSSEPQSAFKKGTDETLNRRRRICNPSKPPVISAGRRHKPILLAHPDFHAVIKIACNGALLASHPVSLTTMHLLAGSGFSCFGFFCCYSTRLYPFRSVLGPEQERFAVSGPGEKDVQQSKKRDQQSKKRDEPYNVPYDDNGPSRYEDNGPSQLPRGFSMLAQYSSPCPLQMVTSSA
jgi:hypothetical protein